MKKITLLLSLIVYGYHSVAQVTFEGNTSVNATTDFVGWNTTPTNAVRIKHEGNFGIEFYTNTGANTFGTPRMMLNAAGYLGLGTGTTTPSSWLHIITSGSTNHEEPFRTAVAATTASNWRMFRGGDEMGNFWFGGTANSLNINASRGGFRIATGNTAGSAAAQSFEIVGGTGADRGWIGIGDWANFDPNVDLHIHGRTTSDFGIQMTNATVGTNSTDGLRLIMNNSGRATLYNWEDDDIALGTANSGGAGSMVERVIISSGLNYGRVGIGTNPGAHLDVYDATDLTGAGDDIGFQVDERLAVGNVVNRGIGAELYTLNGTQTIGISNTIDNYNTTNTGGVYMAGMVVTVRDRSTTTYTDYAEGVAIAMSTNTNYAEHKTGITAVVGETSSTVQNTLNSYGCNFIAQSYNGSNYGGKFEAIRPSGGSGASFGVWAKAPDQTCAGGGTLGSPVSCNGAAGYFDGEVWASGDTYSFSDANLKDNITPIQNASNILSQFAPKQYTFNHQVHPNMSLPYGNHFGFIAQDVLNITPELVADLNHPAEYDSLGNVVYPAFNTLGLNYMGLIPLLVAAVNEQKATIDSLIDAMQNPSPLPNINPLNSQKISLSNVSSIILNQNDPNPFTESTRITFQIPDEVRDAKIIFTSTTGSIINTAIINERGAGELEVYSSELSKGLYNYTLVCDGKVIATKKMVKQ